MESGRWQAIMDNHPGGGEGVGASIDVAVSRRALPALHRPRRRLREQQDEWATALIWVFSLWFLVPRTIQTLAVAKTHTNVGGPQPPPTALSNYSQKLIYLVAVALCLWIIALYLRSSPTRRGVALVAVLVPWLYLMGRDVYVQESPDRMKYLLPLLAIATWLLRPRLSRLEALGYAVGLTVLLSVVIGAALPSHGVLRSSSGDVVTADKQILPWGLLVGVFTDGNNLGQFIAMGLPAIFLIRRRNVRRFGLALCLFALVWSASRGSMLAVGLALLAYVAVRYTKQPSRSLIAFVAGLVPFLVVCILPVITHSPDAFTNRGYIWQASLQSWESDRLFGLGTNWFQRIGSSSGSIGGTVFHAHNQLVQLLVTGGVVAALLVGVLMAIALIAAARLASRGHLFPVTYLAALAGTCIFEVSLVFVDNPTVFPVAVLPLLFILFTSDLDEGPAAPQASGAEAEMSFALSPAPAVDQ